ncbi:MAG: dTDP-4-dehydrorhamnose 3,5-epimerase [Bacteriovoracaceae bacterium]|nr:dTDP-4-dehydrorhamnose 3,5-epimerase [Bacteriovoracaceae bacterium]
MEIITTTIQDLLIIKPKISDDDRGIFYETFQKKKYEKNGITANFVQDNRSLSTKGTLRGLHFQKNPHSQAKLVSCYSGKVLDLVVDLRTSSPTYKQSFRIILDAEEKLQLFIPKGMAHGFYVLSELADFVYKCDEFYHPESESGIHYLSHQIKDMWPMEVLNQNSLKISSKDLCLPHLDELSCEF